MGTRDGAMNDLFSCFFSRFADACIKSSPNYLSNFPYHRSRTVLKTRRLNLPTTTSCHKNRIYKYKCRLCPLT
eukprot:GSA25T00020838001.1